MPNALFAIFPSWLNKALHTWHLSDLSRSGSLHVHLGHKELPLLLRNTLILIVSRQDTRLGVLRAYVERLFGSDLTDYAGRKATLDSC